MVFTDFYYTFWPLYVLASYTRNSNYFFFILFPMTNDDTRKTADYYDTSNNIFKCIFLNENFWISNIISLKCFIYSGSNWQYGIIGSGNGLALNRRQAVIWTNDGLVYWRIYESLGPNGLKDDFRKEQSLPTSNMECQWLTDRGRDKMAAILQTTFWR